MPTACPKCRTENADGSKFCRQCATPLPAAPGGVSADLSVVTVEAPLRVLSTGVAFAGRYRVIEELGEGGMGHVYKAFDTKIQEKIALKLVRPEIACDRRIVERFANEIRLARKITHRNVCRMYDLGDEQGTPYITMEYVSGEDLKRMLRMTGGLSPAQTVAIGRQIASGLAEAHRLGVVHRDLKPHNVMIDREGTARIMDFGIAHSAGTKGLTEHGAMIGTPEYMSPEQAEGEDVDARSDIYSLGVMLFEMATGRPPFQARSALALAMKHKGEPAPDPSTINPRVPTDLSRVILKCLEKDRAARYPSADALVEDLDRLAGELPAATPALPTRRRATSRVLRHNHRAMALALVALLLTAAVGATEWWLLSKRGHLAPTTPSRDSIVVVGFDNLTGDPRFEHLRRAIPRLLMTSLENTGRFKVTTWERMKDVLAQAGRKDLDIIDSEGGFEVCQREGIGVLINGVVTKAGDTFAIDVKVIDAASRALIKSASSKGEGENSILRAQIDEIGNQVVTGLSPARAASRSSVPSVIDVTTGSMDAYAAYLRGTGALERYYYADAIRELEKAVALDPQFASAHLMLSRAYFMIGDRIGRDREISAAKSYASKVTERERLMIEVRSAQYIENNWDKRVNGLKELVARYPDDKSNYLELGTAYQQHGMLEEASRTYEKALALDPSYGLALNFLASISVDLGRPDLAIQYAEKYVATNPDEGNPLDSLGFVYFRLGRFEEAAKGYQRALAMRPDLGSEVGLAMIAAYREDYAAALGWLDKLAANTRLDATKAAAHTLRALIMQMLGRPGEARAEARVARELFSRTQQTAVPDVVDGWLAFDNRAWAESRRAFRRASPLIEKTMSGVASRTVEACIDGLLDAAEGNFASARANLAKAQAAIAESGVPVVGARLHAARIEAALLAHDAGLDEAIAAVARQWPGGGLPGWRLEMFLTYVCPLQQDDLARLYAARKDWNRVILEYKVLTEIGPGNPNQRYIHPLYRYRLAQAYEQAGDKTSAIGQYERFLELWGKADPARAEVKDARARRAALARTTT